MMRHRMLRASAGGILYPHWDKVALAMPMTGPNNSTNFIDLKGHTVTPYGTVKISTARGGSGGSSANFPGVSGSYLRIPHSNDFNVAGDDFTLEFDWWWPGVASGDLISKRNNSETDCRWMVLFVGDHGEIGVQVANSPTTWAINSATAPGALIANQFNKIAIVRSGTVFKIIANDVVVFTATLTGSIYDGTDDLIIGGGGLTGPYIFNALGNMDELLLTHLAKY